MKHVTPRRMYTLLFALALWMPAGPARPQEMPAPVARAIRILDEMERLLAQIIARLQPSPKTAEAGGWRPLFDGKSLAGWKVTDFGGAGEVSVENPFHGGPAAIVVGIGATLSGFQWTGDVPRTRYEIALEAMKLEGTDFMCGLTFPVGESHASLILGGWGGSVVGISSIDNHDASENETTKYISFARDRWYRVRMRVTPEKLEAWLDDEKIVDQSIVGRKISLRPGPISLQIPLGISTYQTRAAFRNIRLRVLDSSG